MPTLPPAVLHPATRLVPEALRPRLRGVLHQWAFPVSLVCGAVLIAMAPTTRAVVAASVYAATLSGLLGVSALYHRLSWSPAADARMQRLDHSMIYCLIAGTFTPFCALTLAGPLGTGVLAVVWGGALAGIATRVLWTRAPRWVTAAIAVALGWTGVVMAPALVLRAGWTPAALVVVGGVLYSLGALVYVRRHPDPRPAVFGYHEVFHTLVIVAALVHYAAVAGWVIPAAA